MKSLTLLRALRYRWTRYEYGPDSLNVGHFYGEINGRKMLVTKRETLHSFFISGHLRFIRPARWYDIWKAAVRNFFFWKTFGWLHHRDIPKRLGWPGRRATSQVEAV